MWTSDAIRRQLSNDQHINSVRSELFVYHYEPHWLHICLGNQEPVERVPVMVGQSQKSIQMGLFDR